MNYPNTTIAASPIGKGSQVRINAEYCQKPVSQSLGLSPDRIYTVQIDHGTRVTVSDEGNTLPSTARRFKKDNLILVDPTIDLETPQDVVCESAQVEATPVVEAPTLSSEEIQSFLVGLGYEPGDDVYLRLLPAKNYDPNNSDHAAIFPKLRYQNEKGIWLKSNKNLKLTNNSLVWITKKKEIEIEGNPWSWIESQSKLGFCPYIVVNPGGQSKDKITKSRVIFWEHDDLPKAEQIKVFREYNDRWKGGMAVETRSSIHCYIRLDEELPPNLIQPTLLRVIQQMGSDKTVNDECRLMRVPGFDHISLVNNVAERFPITLIHSWDGSFASWQNIDKELPQLLDDAKKSKPATTQPIARPEDSEVIEALFSIDPDEDYNEFLRILMSLHSHSPDLLPYAIEWAARAKLEENQYRTESELITKWESFTPNDGISVSTIFYHAKKAGWKSADFDWNAASEKLSGEWANLNEAEKTKRLDNLLVEAVPHVDKGEIDLLLTQLDFDIKKEYPRICYAVNIVRTKLRNENRFDEAATFTGGYFWAVLKSHKIEYDYLRLIKKFGANLKYNILKKQVELNGKVIPVGSSIIDLSVDHGFTGESGLQLPDVFLKVARSHSYHPIKDYLDSVADKFAPDSKIIENLAERYLGQSDSIYNRMLCRTLIAAVARIYDPGCKHDTALFLQGKQGFNKSTFFKVLAGGSEYFDDSLGSVSEKDEKLKMHSVWIVEWAELETVFKKKDISSTKAFLSSQVDTLRLPYGRDNESFPRMSIIVGSTNQDEFLSDSTGNRRFWVIPVAKKIDCELLKLERDEIWAAIVHQYRKGVQHWLSDNEEVKAQSVAEAFQTSHPWTQPVLQYASQYESVSTKDILDDSLHIELPRQTRADEMTVAAILKQAGWNLTRAMVKGRRSSLWFKP